MGKEHLNLGSALLYTLDIFSSDNLHIFGAVECIHSFRKMSYSTYNEGPLAFKEYNIHEMCMNSFNKTCLKASLK